MKKILIIIPAYNEEKNIGAVLDDIKKQKLKADILVVNDGSQDQTSQIARKKGALVADLPINLGIGGARQTGLLYAVETGYKICIQMDADGQHPAKNLKKLITAVAKNNVVIGSRYLSPTKYKCPLIRRIGIEILAKFVSLIIRQKITDPTSGLRIFSGKTIDFLAKNYPLDYPEVEPILFLHWVGFKIKEIPVEMMPRSSGQSSISPFYYMLKVILAIIINLIRKRPKLEL